ncbi:hypothetical protein E2C01_010915 [Portunus trituberculatus]|uniref:Uncharacterized protein n=1 Tax=Portunus trituberculatus TaxID=210409 RepID=A0A5B7D9N1_PORTR|nr:hypothetical protein [Portunus trituberculatus]
MEFRNYGENLDTKVVNIWSTASVVCDSRLLLRPYDNHGPACRLSSPHQLTSYYGFLWWSVEGEAQGHHGSHLQDDERHVLQCLPYQRQERLRGLRRDDIGAESLSPMLHVTGIPTQPCRGRSHIHRYGVTKIILENFDNVDEILYKVVAALRWGLLPLVGEE